MPDYPTGPAATFARGAVIEAYADTGVLEIPCAYCGVGEGEFCRHESGKERKMPCPKRIAAVGRINDAAKAKENSGGPSD